MHAASFLPLALAALVTLPGTATHAQEVDVRAEFVKLHAAQDADGVRALWAAHPGAILVVIDEDLEGSLSLWEAVGDGEPSMMDMELIAGHHERALWGAALATEVTGRAIFSDYASSFVGWNADEKRAFRGGQAAFGRARQAMAASEWDAALAAGKECTTLALPLGDWWGTAMGLSAEARAQLGKGDAVAALAAASRSRLLYQQLGLAGSELGAVDSMLTALESLGRSERALVCAEAAVVLAGQIDNADAVAAFTARRDALK